MDPRERIQDMRIALTATLDGRQAETWTTMPGFVVKYDAARQVCQVQIAISIQTIDPQNTDNPIQRNIPVLTECPVIFPHGGGYTLTFPIQPGDECLVFLASRCIDNWWALGPVLNPSQQQPIQGDLRMHDLSDGFVLVGPRSLPNVISGVSTNTVQLRSDDGQAYVEIAGGHVVNVKTPSTVNIQAGGDINLQAGGKITTNSTGDTTMQVGGGLDITATNDVDITTPTVDVMGQVTATGEVTAEAGSANITLSTHVHGGVTTGGSDTTGPIG